MVSPRSLLLASLLAPCLVVGVLAQSNAQFTQEDKQKCSSLVDAVRARIDAGQIDKARDKAADLLSCLIKWAYAEGPSPQQALDGLERQAAGKDELARFYALARLAKAAVEADLSKAEAYANELLELAARYPKDWNYGNAIHDGNMVLGRVALRRNDIESAKRLLLAAGQTPGSPQLNTFGPNMSLAKDLIERGERETVVEYFSLCRKFWKMGADELDDWTTLVKGGRTPSFGANLVY